MFHTVSQVIRYGIKSVFFLLWGNLISHHITSHFLLCFPAFLTNDRHLGCNNEEPLNEICASKQSGDRYSVELGSWMQMADFRGCHSSHVVWGVCDSQAISLLRAVNQNYAVSLVDIPFP